jgi:hypothetical protein
MEKSISKEDEQTGNRIVKRLLEEIYRDAQPPTST